jgi:hypothetical protein
MASGSGMSGLSPVRDVLAMPGRSASDHVVKNLRRFYEK